MTLAPRPASAEDDTIAALAARRLREAADLVEASGDADMLAAAARDLPAWRLIAGHVATDPRGDPVRSGAARDLVGRVDPRSDRRWSHGELAGEMLVEAAVLLTALDGPSALPAFLVDDDDTPLRRAAADCRHAAMLIRAAPEARFGPEFDALLPYLAMNHRVVQGDAAARLDPETAERLLALPRFRDLAARSYTAHVGRDFETLPEAQQRVWAAGVGGAWVMRHGRPNPPLTAREIEAIAFAAGSPRQDWFMPPLLAGDWTDLEAADAAAVLALVGDAERVGSSQTPITLRHHCDRVRSRPLDSHGGVLMVEMQAYDDDAAPALIAAVLHDDGLVLADGSSRPIYTLNDQRPPRLETPEARRDYLLLFLNWVRGDVGRFQPIEDVHALDHRLTDPTWATAHLAPHVRRISEAGQETDGAYKMRAVVAYGDGLFKALFRLMPGGEIEMIDDEPLVADAPVFEEVQNGPLLSLAVPPSFAGA